MIKQRTNSTASQPKKLEATPLLEKKECADADADLPFIGSPEGEGYTPKKHIFPVKLALDLFCHAGIAAMCVCVTMDIVLLALPIHLLYYVFGENFFRNAMTWVIDWTTPCVLCIPFSWCGCKVHIQELDWVADTMKTSNSLVLANHGSRIDWIIGMYVGFTGRTRSRVGFVCEGLIQYMPIVGWYRKLVCEDCFVMRSFKQDKKRILDNVNGFHRTNTQRLVFLSPEGVVCDYGERDLKYINNCRKFCKEQGYQPFDYILTPRYKGLTVLSEHIRSDMLQKEGQFMSTTIAYSRAGTLLNSKLLYTFPARQHADLYTIYSGILGEPVNMHLQVHKMKPFTEDCDIKSIMMNDYARRDKLLAHFHKNGHFPNPESYVHVPPNHFVLNFFFAMHFVVLFGLASLFGKAALAANVCIGIFSMITFFHTIGYFINDGTSMESVPFETGIKSILIRLMAKHSEHKTGADSKHA